MNNKMHIQITVKQIFTLIICICWATLSAPIYAANKSHFIGIAQLNVNASTMGILPGDTILLESGKRKSLKISNVLGDSLNYVIITNAGGDVIIENTDFHYGFVMSNSRFFRLTGNYKNGNNYGIRILKTGEGANGLGIGELSTNYEVDHIEIANTGFAGIFAFSQPTCDLSANKGQFEQRNTIIRDNYIHDTYGEGMYLGHSFYTGYTITCDSENKKVFPHEIKGLKVYNNLLENIGYDGIQVCSAVDDTEVYNNRIYNYGTLNEETQHSGIQIGAGTKLKCYNNSILKGSGTGIMMLGLADSYIFNNLIVDAGKNFYPEDATLRIHGIFVDDRLTYSNTSHYILNNTIISPKSDGIRFISTLSSKNIIANNLIVKPGSVYVYEPENNRFINLKQESDVSLHTNFYTDYTNGDMNADSINSIYECLSTLPIANRGIDCSFYNFDFDFFNKSRNLIPSIGAFEYPTKNSMFSVKKSDIELFEDSKNGVFSIENTKNDNLKRITIVDLSGKKLYEMTLNEPRFVTFNVKDHLTKGIYIIYIERSNLVFAHKFIVNSI